MNTVDLIILEIETRISGNTESGIISFDYDDLFDFSVGTIIKRDRKQWVITENHFLFVVCELKQDNMYKKEFTKQALVKAKFKIGDKITWYAPNDILSLQPME